MKEMVCPTCGMRLPLDPKDVPVDSDHVHDAGRTIETVIPGTVSIADAAIAPHRINGASVNLTSAPPNATIGVSLTGSAAPAVAHTIAPEPVAQPPVTPASQDALAAPVPDPVVAVRTSEADALGMAPVAEPAALPRLDSDSGSKPNIRSVDAGASEEYIEPRAASWRLVLLGSYASAVTLACLWLLWQGRTRNDAGGRDGIAADSRFERGLRADRSRVLPPLAPLPDDHVTTLGKPLRIGQLEFTPLEMTTGAVLLVRKGLDADGEQRDGGQGALILRVRLHNLSSDQVFAPLDEAFLRTRDREAPDSLIETGARTRLALYPLAVESELSIVGQEFRELRPGESFETTVVSEKDADENATGDLMWRLRVRTSAARTDVVGVRVAGSKAP
jgi:hypothetical protein